MKKTFNIVIGDISLHVDEDALAFLEDRLNYLENSLKNKSDDFVLADIEAKIGVALVSEVGENGVVTLNTMKNVLGKNEFFCNLDSSDYDMNSSSEKQNAQSEYDSSLKKESYDNEEPWVQAMRLGRKLFRNPYDAVIGGVISGFAGYFNVSVMPLRLLVVVASVSLSFYFTVIPFILLYLLLYLVIPAARNIIDLTRSRKPLTMGIEADVDEKAWKTNYEHCMQQMTYPQKGGCIAGGAKLLFILVAVLVLLPLIVLAGFLLTVFCLFLFALFSTFGYALFADVYIVLLFLVPLIAFVHWVLKKNGVCRPMNGWLKATIIIGWFAILVCSAVKVYEKVENSGGIEVLRDAIIDKRYQRDSFWENLIEKHFGKLADEMSYGYSAWIDDTHNIPFVIDAKRSKAFDKITVRFIDESVWNGEDVLQEYEGCSTVELSLMNRNSGSICFVWDSIANEVIVDLASPELANLGHSLKIDSYNIPVRYINSDDTINYCNAADNGKVPFKIRFLSGLLPQLYVYGSDKEDGLFVPAVKNYAASSYSINNVSGCYNDSVSNVTTPNCP